jgi:hypothetical protein
MHKAFHSIRSGKQVNQRAFSDLEIAAQHFNIPKQCLLATGDVDQMLKVALDGHSAYIR